MQFVRTTFNWILQPKFVRNKGLYLVQMMNIMIHLRLSVRNAQRDVLNATIRVESHVLIVNQAMKFSHLHRVHCNFVQLFVQLDNIEISLLMRVHHARMDVLAALSFINVNPATQLHLIIYSHRFPIQRFLSVFRSIKHYLPKLLIHLFLMQINSSK